MQRPRYVKRLIIADFGSGLAELSKLLPSNRVYSFDHSKVLGDSIIECDMCHTGLKDNEIDVAVFSLSLMGLNWIDYIKEARRVLTDQGHILIATTNRELDEHGTLYKEEKGRVKQQLVQLFKATKVTVGIPGLVSEKMLKVLLFALYIRDKNINQSAY